MADMSNNADQANMAEQDPGVVPEEDNGEVGAVPEDVEDIEDTGHWVWRRGRLQRGAVGSWNGQSRAGRLYRVWYPSV